MLLLLCCPLVHGDMEGGQAARGGALTAEALAERM